jgi:DNA repair protein RadA/Sms
VLEKRVGLHLGSQDVFVNVAGGLRIDEPAVDLGVAASIASSHRDVAVDPQAVAVGEIGLGGEIRAVGHVEKRVQEAAKLGFKRIVLPRTSARTIKPAEGIDIVAVDRIDQAMEALLR